MVTVKRRLVTVVAIEADIKAHQVLDGDLIRTLTRVIWSQMRQVHLARLQEILKLVILFVGVMVVLFTLVYKDRINR